MHMQPSFLPLMTSARKRPCCSSFALVEVVHEQHGVREVREREARVALRELVVDDHRAQVVHSATPERRRDGEPEQPELSAPLEERAVEAPLGVVLFRLRLDVLAHEALHHLAEEEVFFGGVLEEMSGVHGDRQQRVPSE
jgi:hypothetical protein